MSKFARVLTHSPSDDDWRGEVGGPYMHTKNGRTLIVSKSKTDDQWNWQVENSLGFRKAHGTKGTREGAMKAAEQALGGPS